MAGNHKHVYNGGWLERFSRPWRRIRTDPSNTLAETADHVAPLGKIYLPTSSYREMTEWVLPPRGWPSMRKCPRDGTRSALGGVEAIRRGGIGGTSRSAIRVDEMYCRMMMVSRRLERVAESGAIRVARTSP